MAKFFKLSVLFMTAFGSVVSSADSSVARSMFEMEEGIYAPTANYCAVILRYPYDRPNKLVIEYVSNPFIVPAAACNVQGRIVEFSPRAEDGADAESADKTRLSRASARSFRVQWIESNGVLNAGILHSRAN